MTADRLMAAEFDGRGDLLAVAAELQRYAAAVAPRAHAAFSSAVMARVSAEPLPRRGLLGAILAPLAVRGPMQRAAQAAVLMAVVVVAVGGGVAVGRLAELIRNLPGGPTVPGGVLSPGEPDSSQGWRTPAVDEPVSPSPSSRPSRRPAATHQIGDELGTTPQPSPTAGAAGASPSGSPEATDGLATDSPEPSPSGTPGDGGGGSGSGSSGSGSSGSGSSGSGSGSGGSGGSEDPGG